MFMDSMFVWWLDCATKRRKYEKAMRKDKETPYEKTKKNVIRKDEKNAMQKDETRQREKTKIRHGERRHLKLFVVFSRGDFSSFRLALFRLFVF